MVKALEEDRVLRHPPIVTEASDKRDDAPCFIVLDGATRTTALRHMGYRHILVQVVDYSAPEVALGAWHHLLQEIAPEELVARVRAIPGVQIVEMDAHHAESALAVRQLLCYFVLRDRTVWGIRGGDELSEQTELLNRVVNIYRGHATLYRVVTTQLDLLLSEYPEMMALVVFPRYAPAEVIHLALNNAKVPMGITRHLIGGRVLNVTLDLQILASEDSLEDKNKWLGQWLNQKVHARQVRFYGEPVFFFEE